MSEHEYTIEFTYANGSKKSIVWPIQHRLNIIHAIATMTTSPHQSGVTLDKCIGIVGKDKHNKVILTIDLM